MRELGLAYLGKESASPSDTEAGIEWLTRATEAGDHVAPYELALYRTKNYDMVLGRDDIMPLVLLAAERGNREAVCTLQFYGLSSSETLAENSTRSQDSCGSWTPPDEFDLIGVRLVETDHPPLTKKDENFSTPFEVP
ncbi:MAG: hypothetical protein AAGA69_00080 [Pseudomonadota bacterium]